MADRRTMVASARGAKTSVAMGTTAGGGSGRERVNTTPWCVNARLSGSLGVRNLTVNSHIARV